MISCKIKFSEPQTATDYASTVHVACQMLQPDRQPREVCSGSRTPPQPDAKIPIIQALAPGQTHDAQARSSLWQHNLNPPPHAHTKATNAQSCLLVPLPASAHHDRRHTALPSSHDPAAPSTLSAGPSRKTHGIITAMKEQTTRFISKFSGGGLLQPPHDCSSAGPIGACRRLWSHTCGPGFCVSSPSQLPGQEPCWWTGITTATGASARPGYQTCCKQLTCRTSACTPRSQPLAQWTC